MKSAIPLAFALGTHGIQLQEESTPMARVATLLNEMHARIETDGRKEQMSYDKYACWCESTLGRKAADIAQAKKDSVTLQTTITRLFGELGAHGAEIKQLTKDIAENLEAQREARSIRENQNSDYEGEKTESEQCIGALEAAVKTLTAGTRGGFLETMKEVELLSVVSGIRGALKHESVSKTIKQSDMALIDAFLKHPSDFVGKRASNMMSALQIANNPFGDYAPQSTQISGILKGMYQTFTQDLEKANVEEATSQKAHEELMATKKQELLTLETTLGQQRLDSAQKSMDRDTANEQLDETKAQLDADEKFFDVTKAGCQEKAGQWAVRSRLRTEELTGVRTAVNILTSQDAQNVFANSTTTFVQVKSVTLNSVRMGASAKLAHLAREFNSLGLANLAVDMRTGGHFDKVIATVDKMIANLRQEGQDDIDHRDRCQRAEDKNGYETTDLNAAIGKADTDLGRLNQEDLRLQGEIDNLKTEINATKTSMQDALDLRNDAVADFRQALKDDVDAVALLEETMVALSRFYTSNKIPMSLAQGKSAPEYTVDPDKAPDTTWSNEKYGGRSEETHGVVEIIRMIKEDVEKEIKTARADNADAQAQYEKERGALEETLSAQLALKASTEREQLETQAQHQAVTKHKNAKNKDLNAETALTTAIYSDCSWVAQYFDSRRTKRAKEIEGLIDAKGYLGGAEDGSMI